MPGRHPKHPRNLHELAALIRAHSDDDDKEPAEAPARTDGVKAGRAPTAQLTPEQRADLAAKAATVRWRRDR